MKTIAAFFGLVLAAMAQCPAVPATAYPALETILNDKPCMSGGGYVNPNWITSLAWAKITGVPSFEPAISAGTTTQYWRGDKTWQIFPTFNQSTTGNAATATALATLPTKCSAGNYPLGVDASGNAQNCTVAAGGGLPAGMASDGAGGYIFTGALSASSFNSTAAPPSVVTLQNVSGNITTLHPATGVSDPTFPVGTGTLVYNSGNVATATALAATPTKCGAGNYPLGVDASGNAQNCTAAGGGGTTFVPFYVCPGPCTPTEVTTPDAVMLSAGSITTCTMSARLPPTGTGTLVLDLIKNPTFSAITTFTGGTSVFSSTTPTLTAGGASQNTVSAMSAAATYVAGDRYVVAVLTASGSTFAGQGVTLACK